MIECDVTMIHLKYLVDVIIYLYIFSLNAKRTNAYNINILKELEQNIFLYIILSPNHVLNVI